MNSTHKVEVVPVQLMPHPNADTLSIVRIFDSYVTVVKTEQWQGVDRGAFIPPDSVVPDQPVFSFLNGSFRIKARKYRGIVSQGLLHPAPEGSQIGDDVAEQLGIIHYEPPISFRMGDAEVDPPIPGYTYDLDTWFRYSSLLPEGTDVEVTEKIHGTNFRATFQDGKMHVGSRSHYRKESAENLYWMAVKANPWIEKACKLHPGLVFYGEVFGWVQKLRYGAKPSTPPMLRIFDIWNLDRFVSVTERHSIMKEVGTLEETTPPILYLGPYEKSKIETLINGPSMIPSAQHHREGIVIKPLNEMWCPEIGRLVLKAVSPIYLEKSEE